MTSFPAGITHPAMIAGTTLHESPCITAMIAGIRHRSNDLEPVKND